MRAAVFDRYGPPDVLRIEDVATPVPKVKEILVRTYASTVCAPDWRIRSARPFFIRLISGLRRPKKRILGLEFAGRVEAVGAEVTRFHVGDEVFGSTGFAFGAHAEFVCLSQDHRGVAMKPATVSFQEAAGILFGGVSALYFLRKCEVRAGDNVLIYGASGSVGVAAVQLAKHFGARVTGVCSGANVDLVKSVGADAVLDYQCEDFSSSGHVYDVILDAVGKSGFSRSLRALKPNGRYAQVALTDFGTILLSLLTSITRKGVGIGGMARTEPGDIELLSRLAETGELRTVIDRTFSLEQIAEAHRLSESGHKRGVAVIEIAPPQP